MKMNMSIIRALYKQKHQNLQLKAKFKPPNITNHARI